MRIANILKSIGDRWEGERRSLDERFYHEGEQAMRKTLDADRVLLEERSAMAESTGQLREYQRIVQEAERLHGDMVSLHRSYTEGQGREILNGVLSVGKTVHDAAQREFVDIERRLGPYIEARRQLNEQLPKLSDMLTITGVLRYQQLEDTAGEIQLFIPVAYAARQTPKTLVADLYDHAVVALTGVESNGLSASDRADRAEGLTVLVLSCERAQAIEVLPVLSRELSVQPRRLKEARTRIAIYYDARPFPGTEALAVHVGKLALDTEDIPRLLAAGYDLDRLQHEFVCPDNVHKIVAGYRAAETRRQMRPGVTPPGVTPVAPTLRTSDVRYPSLDALARQFDTSTQTLRRCVADGLRVGEDGSVRHADLVKYFRSHPGRGRGNAQLKALRGE